MEKKIEKKKLTEMDTYVFIDVSNIRAACLKTCGFRVDFVKFAQYLKKKYPNLKTLNYYEGMAKDDRRKAQILAELENSGYSVKTLERKSYIKPATKREYICEKCRHKNRVVVIPKYKVLKSNVDVYLTTEMLETVFRVNGLAHIIIVSCDGDYAEAIKAAINRPGINVTVMATPMVKNARRNTLSSRIKELTREIPCQFQLMNINTIEGEIASKNEDDPEGASSRVGNTSPVT